MSEQEFDCDLAIPFSIKIKGTKKWYCVGHMSGTARDAYLKELMSVSKISVAADGTSKVDLISYDGMSTMLLKHCVYGYTRNADGTGNSTGDLVPSDVIGSFPAPVLDKLVAKANAINALGEETLTTAKND